MSKESEQVKKILITARNSYIGNSFAAWVASDKRYSTDYITCRTEEWKQKSFSDYDVILHVAGIAHTKAKSDQESLYYKVNRDLTIELAKKAKAEGVKQFIFLSSMIVYGESNTHTQSMIITKDSQPNPSGFYGDSKLQAERGIAHLQDESFHVVIIRPPMIYGGGTKGNFPKLSKLAKVIPIFPEIDNKRSMLYIDNLCEFIRLMIDNAERGIFHPQNKEYVNTTELVRSIGLINGRKILVTKLFNPGVILLSKRISIVNKLFGTFIYDRTMSHYKENYNVIPFKESIDATEMEI